jgi:hypothetical protein
MSYTLPQVQVFQEANLIPTAIDEPLYACIVGGHAQLFRYAEADERALIALGAYDYLNNTDYSYPNRPAGGIVDQDYVVLYADDVLLLYYTDEESSGATTVNPDATYANRVTSSAVSFIDNEFGGVTYPRDPVFLDRDCAVGDTVYIQGNDGISDYDLWTTIRDFHGIPIPGTVGAAYDNSGNEPTHAGLDVDIVQSGGDENCVRATADGTGYDGSVEGDIRETYTITVTQGSTGGDFTTALLRVRSASGNDDADDVVPSAAGVATVIGARGLEVTFEVPSLGSCSLEAVSDSLSPDDLLDGQVWTVTITQLFTAPVPTSGGTYAGATDTTYIITVTSGGIWAASPQITVTTTTGSDISGPTTVTGAGVAVPVGTQGVTISFDGVGVDRLRAGDIYYIEATAAGEGAMTTIELNHNLPTALQNPAIDLTLMLFINQDDVVIPYRSVNPGAYNYELGAPGVDDTGFTVNANIQLYDSTWTDAGVPQPLPLYAGDLYLEYRAWLCTYGDTVYSCASDDDLDAITGQQHPDNPLKWAVYEAWRNSNGTPVYYIAVCDPSDSDTWNDALDMLSGRRTVYGLVPLTYDTAILSGFTAHVDEQSTAEMGRPRVVWINAYMEPVIVIADDANSEDEAQLLATIGEDPGNPGQFTIVDIPAGNAQFEALGVRAGDVMRYNYSTDAWGVETYDEYVIDTTLSEDSFRLLSGQGTVADPAAKRMEVWRVRTVSDLATALSAQAQSYGDSRYRYVWPDEVGDGTYTFEGWHMCAALAGLRSGVAPHQGMTNLEITGFTDVSRTDDLFTRAQLDDMANAGVWFVTETDDGDIVSRHAITTAGYGDLETQEEMIVSNADSIDYGFRTILEALFGVSNATDGTLEIVRLALEGKIAEYKQTHIARLGGQLVDGTVVEVRRHGVMSDRIVVNTDLTLPAPLNNVDMYQQIVV